MGPRPNDCQPGDSSLKKFVARENLLSNPKKFVPRESEMLPASAQGPWGAYRPLAGPEVRLAGPRHAGGGWEGLCPPAKGLEGEASARAVPQHA